MMSAWAIPIGPETMLRLKREAAAEAAEQRREEERAEERFQEVAQAEYAWRAQHGLWRSEAVLREQAVAARAEERAAAEQAVARREQYQTSVQALMMAGYRPKTVAEVLEIGRMAD